MTLIQPKLIVELGTHYGESYFGLCQAVAENGLSTQCFAVDTWRGDDHAGFYGEEVFAEVNAYSAQRYAGFSKLLRTTFEDALGTFSDGSIDLLHIDGLHTYEAVRKDFEQWCVKVRPGGVILLHDICVRHADFGVWRLWAELQERYRTFEFLHCWGLGVVEVPGGSSDGFVQDLVGSSDAEGSFVRHYYSVLALALEHDRLRDRELAAATPPPVDPNKLLIANLERTQQALQDELAQMRGEQERLKADQELLKAEQEHLKTEQEVLKAEQEHLKAEQERLKTEQEHLKAAHLARETESERLIATNQELRQELAHWPARLEREQQQRALVDREIQAVQQERLKISESLKQAESDARIERLNRQEVLDSYSWKVTAPLRTLGRFASRWRPGTR